MKKIFITLFLSMNLWASQEFLDAAEKGDLSQVQRFIKQDRDVVSFRDYALRTALILAASNGHTAVVKFLLDNRAEIDAEDGIGNTALMLAASSGHPVVVNLLLNYRADRNHQNQVSQKAISMTLFSANQLNRKKFLSSGKKATLKENFALVAKLLLTGTDEPPRLFDDDVLELQKLLGVDPQNLLTNCQSSTPSLPKLITSTLENRLGESGFKASPRSVPLSDLTELVISYLDADELLQMVAVHLSPENKVVVTKLNPGKIASFLEGAQKYLNIGGKTAH